MNTKHITSEAIEQMPTRERAAMINALSGFKSASLIGSIDKQGRTNLAIFSSVVHIGSNPALIGFISRPDSSDRHTLDKILESKNTTRSTIFMPASTSRRTRVSARYPRELSESEAVGLSPEFIGNMPAPYVLESRIKYGLEFAEKDSTQYQPNHLSYRSG
jgi:flavin reductase (DIM6/NTAB) family NADH-FMN oxidoreductase RutF